MTTTTAPSPLPHAVAAAPPRPTMLYDGRCNLCTASADRIRAYDTARALDVLSLQDPVVAQRFPEISREAVLKEMHVVEPDGHIERGAEAVRAVLRYLPGLRWFGLAWLIPGFSILAGIGYRWVARNRYRFNRKVSCDGSVCRMHG